MMINKFLNLFMITDGKIQWSYLDYKKLHWKKISLQFLNLFGFLTGKLLNHHRHCIFLIQNSPLWVDWVYVLMCITVLHSIPWYLFSKPHLGNDLVMWMHLGSFDCIYSIPFISYPVLKQTLFSHWSTALAQN